MKIERAFISGGREFTAYDRIEADLRALLPLGLHRVAEGASNGGGADWLARDAWRNITGRSTERYRVDSAIDGRHRGAPSNRNVRMVEAELRLAQLASETIVGLFYPDPDSRGTWHCLAEAVKRGITCIVWVDWVCIAGAAQNACCEVHRYGVAARRILDLSSISWGYEQFNARRVGIDADVARRSALLKALHR